jgi:hypothetical protein
MTFAKSPTKTVAASTKVRPASRCPKPERQFLQLGALVAEGAGQLAAWHEWMLYASGFASIKAAARHIPDWPWLNWCSTCWIISSRLAKPVSICQRRITDEVSV